MFLQSMLSSEHYIDEKVFYEAVRQYIVSTTYFLFSQPYNAWCIQNGQTHIKNFSANSKMFLI